MANRLRIPVDFPLPPNDNGTLASTKTSSISSATTITLILIVLFLLPWSW